MKKILLEEINRINELLGTKQKLDEQLGAFIKSLAPALKDDFLDAARSLITTRTIRQIDDLSETELLSVLKSNAAKIIRRNIYAEITSRLSMNATKFASKTSLELLQDLRALGVKDPDLAAAYLKRFAKENSVDTADKKFASVITTNLPPTGGRKTVDVDVDISKKSSTEIADEMAKRYGKQQIQDFTDKLTVIGFDEKTKKMFLLDYKNYHDWTGAMLEAEYKSLKSKLSKNQEKTVNKILSYLSGKNLKNIGISIFAIMVITWVLKNTDKLTGFSESLKKLNPFKGGEESEENTTNDDEPMPDAPTQ